MGVSERRRALITGISGQDGSYLAELLLERDYEVVGMVRGPLTRPLPNLEHLRSRLVLLEGDLAKPPSIRETVEAAQPDEIYHLAAPTFVPRSWEDPGGTLRDVAVATADLLSAVSGSDRRTRVYVASSSEIFGDAGESPQTERTRCRPATPYGVAKLAAHLLVRTVRAQGLFACSGITYNHESPRRPEHFVTRKVTRAAAAIKLGLQSEVVLGDLEAVRDWSYAGDVVRGAWLMLQADRPEDYILASGVGRPVQELVDVAFDCVGLRAADHVRVDPALQRPMPATLPVGDPSRARAELGWTARVGFEEMIGAMVKTDLERLRQPVGEQTG